MGTEYMAQSRIQLSADIDPYDCGYGSICLCDVFLCALKREHPYTALMCIMSDISMCCVSISVLHSFNALLESSTAALQRPIQPCNSNNTVVMRSGHLDIFL